MMSNHQTKALSALVTLLTLLTLAPAAMAQTPAEAPNGRLPIPVEETGGDPLVAIEAQPEDDQTLGKALSLGGVGATHAALYTWAYFAWYRGRRLSPTLELRDEGFFGIDTYAGGADKLGHMYSNYVLTRATSKLLQSGGWSPASASLMSAGLTASFFTAIEIKDGYHKNFGFSWGDMTFNGLGIGLALLLENFPALDERFDIKVEYVPTELFIDQLVNEGVTDAAEDYSGQTFMLAYHLASIDALEESQAFGWLRYADLTVGFKSTNYLPKPVDGLGVPQQDLFVGVSLNVQQVLTDVFYPSPDSRGAGYKTLRFTNEFVAVPYTTLPLVTGTRTAADEIAGL